ncbi:hypothetical protein JYK00_09365 [Thermosipho ferrireducens]|uniref:Uncharacterized protein n=1 Tax=Thermosipho ferrireducens TaxID=2571116 RepID=A0ABX7S7T7_9BACT|nr:hypothetical protein [Thermosipho ferrireducens]QTA37911.1 hypothetical protein JYK00_09365 [Thermosipho ferrireducens]
MKSILNNCFLLIIPILIWNLLFAHKLIEAGYPISTIKVKRLEWLENTLRFAVFIIPLFMKFNVSDIHFLRYLTLYIAGILIYFAAWLMIIYFPESKWSTYKIGLLAPGYTPTIWLIAIGLLGNLKIYIYLSIAFVIIHTLSSYFKLKIANVKD